MKDYFKEQLVTHLPNKADRNRRIVILVISALVILFLWNLFDAVAVLNPDYYFSLMILLVMVVAVVIFIACHFSANINREYEYAYTSGNLDIDVIYNKKKRKQVFSGSVEEFEVMAHILDTQHLAMYSGLKTKDFSSGQRKDNTYIFVTVYKGKKQKFIFEPCPEIIKAIRLDLSPRRLFLRK
ncbi:MAG: hypothetical protein ACI4VF_10705 [Lachnospirales bacterium]